MRAIFEQLTAPHGTSSQMHSLGICCADLSDALALPDQRSFFTYGKGGVLFMTVVAVQRDGSTGCVNQAAMFCPFCGTRMEGLERAKGMARR
jgi:hypothetical protein